MDRFYHFNRCAALMRRGSISVKTICSNVGDLQRKLFLILAFSVAVLSTYANDILPKEGASLNFILVGFDVKEANKDFVATELEIAIGSFNAADDFLKAKSITKKGAKSDYLVELPQFGVPYTWRMKFRNAKGQISYTSLNHFSVLELPPSFDEHRMNVTVHANKYQEAYVFYDGTKALYNMQGKVVWFMPKIGDFNPEKEGVRDLKETSDGTISFLGNGVPMEIGFCGNLIWKAPKNDSADRNGEGNFHHQFQKLKNGHYMTMGTEYRFWRLCRVGECNKASLLDDRTEFGNESNIIKAPFTTLVEYDSLGNVVWKWNSLDYVLNSDIYYHPGENGFVDIDAHANSFSFDRNRKRIYVSFKNINRIVAVSYPE